MTGHFTAAVSLFLLGIGGRILNNYYDQIINENIVLTLFMFVGFFLLRMVVSIFTREYVSNSKIRYTIRKSFSIGLIAILSIVLLQIWVKDPQSLLVAYGLIAAGVAVSLQDIFKNFAGGIALLTSGMYRVGNRISISEHEGDVIDIGLFYTTLLEVGNWVDGDQSTGRIITVPNGVVLSGMVHNYSRDHHYLWDEIALPITYTSDLDTAVEILSEIAGLHTNQFTEGAKRSIGHMEQRYYVSERTMQPSVYVRATDNWVMLTVRYVVRVRERRQVMSDITKDILGRLRVVDNVTVASETVDIVGFPEKD
jgi:small-conductance mechanosensitive channel